MENQYKLVDFMKYCNTCEHKSKKDYEDPCNDCLAQGANVNSEKPIYYKEKEN